MKPRLRLIVDTNVWLDCYIPARPQHASARSFLDAAIANGANLLVSIGTVKDLYYLMGAQVKRMIRENRQVAGEAAGTIKIGESEAAVAKDMARGYLANMLDLADVVGADAGDVWLARKFETIHPDFEDDLVIAAAHRCDADYVITNDRSFIAHSPVAALSTDDAKAMLEI